MYPIPPHLLLFLFIVFFFLLIIIIFLEMFFLHALRTMVCTRKRDALEEEADFLIGPLKIEHFLPVACLEVFDMPLTFKACSRCSVLSDVSAFSSALSLSSVTPA